MSMFEAAIERWCHRHMEWGDMNKDRGRELGNEMPDGKDMVGQPEMSKEREKNSKALPLEYRVYPIYPHLDIEEALRVLLSGPYPTLRGSIDVALGKRGAIYRWELLDADGEAIMSADSLNALLTMVLRQKTLNWG